MGWWGYGIMEGDSPLGAKSTIDHILESSDYLAKLIDFCRNGDKYSGNDDKPIRYHVAGAVMMARGLHIPDEFKEEIISNSDDNWNALERKNAISKFISTLRSYTGNPTVIESKGLFQTMTDHLAQNA